LHRLVLIDNRRHNEGMFGSIFIALIVALVPLAYFAGADSRIDEVARGRRFHG
jgi:hypothetical protein